MYISIKIKKRLQKYSYDRYLDQLGKLNTYTTQMFTKKHRI